MLKITWLASLPLTAGKAWAELTSLAPARKIILGAKGEPATGGVAEAELTTLAIKGSFAPAKIKSSERSPSLPAPEREIFKVHLAFFLKFDGQLEYPILKLLPEKENSSPDRSGPKFCTWMVLSTFCFLKLCQNLNLQLQN